MMDRIAELEVIAGLKRGDESAFDRVFDEYRARIFSFILRLTGRKDVAEDLAQELWLRLAARAWTLREDTHLGAWLFTVARNLCISFWRSRGEFEPIMKVNIEKNEMRGNRPFALPRTAEAEELRHRIEQALAALPLNYRELLILIGIEGLSPADAALIIGVKPEALRKRLERARKMFAAKLGGNPARKSRRRGRLK